MTKSSQSLSQSLIPCSLLSAYDLLKSGLFPSPYDESLVDALLSQAKSLATAISPVFNTATGLPAANLNFTSQQIVQSTTTVNGTKYNSTNTAQAGTLILEYYRLSDLTGDESFRDNVRLFIPLSIPCPNTVLQWRMSC